MNSTNIPKDMPKYEGWGLIHTGNNIAYLLLSIAVTYILHKAITAIFLEIGLSMYRGKRNKLKNVKSDARKANSSPELHGSKDLAKDLLKEKQKLNDNLEVITSTLYNVASTMSMSSHLQDFGDYPKEAKHGSGYYESPLGPAFTNLLGGTSPEDFKKEREKTMNEEEEAEIRAEANTEPYTGSEY